MPFLVQDVSLPVYELLLVTFLHRIFQTQVSEVSGFKFYFFYCLHKRNNLV